LSSGSRQMCLGTPEHRFQVGSRAAIRDGPTRRSGNRAEVGPVLRLATWNCCSGGASKVDRLGDLGVDVAVLCEAPLANPRPDASLVDPALSWLSIGKFGYKSLAVAGLTRSVTAMLPSPRDGRWTLRADVENGPSILGIWSCPEGTADIEYGLQVIASLDAHAYDLARGDVIVAGDFNVGQSLGTGQPGMVEPVRRRWEELGLVSVYHALREEPVGQATVATHFHKRKRESAFVVDYVLIHESRLSRVDDVQVGTYGDWVATGLSDHVPIVVDLHW